MDIKSTKHIKSLPVPVNLDQLRKNDCLKKKNIEIFCFNFAGHQFCSFFNWCDLFDNNFNVKKKQY